MGFSLNSFSAERTVVPLPVTRYGSRGGRRTRWGHVLDVKLLESVFMRITEAARRLGTSARMLRYREDLGLLPQVRERAAAVPGGAGAPAVQCGGSRRRSRGARTRAPLRHQPGVAGVRRARAGRAAGPGRGGRPGPAAGRIPAPASRALDFEKERALRLLSRGDKARRRTACSPRRTSRPWPRRWKLERRYDVSPAALAFGVRVLAEPAVRAAVADLGTAAGPDSRLRPAGPWTSRRRRALRLLSRRLELAAQPSWLEPWRQLLRSAAPFRGADPGFAVDRGYSGVPRIHRQA